MWGVIIATISKLGINLSISTAAFSSGLNKARGKMKGFGKALASTKGLLVSFAGALALKAVFSKFKSMVESTLASIDRLQKSAIKIGTTTKALGSLQFAAGLSGTATEAFNNALTKMNINLGKAPTKVLSDGLADAGIELSNLIGLNTEDKFKAIAEGIRGISDPAKKAAAAAAIFGKSGTDLIPMFAAGSKGISKMQEEYVKLGGSISDVDAAQIAQANDALAAASLVLTGIKNKIVIAIAPAIEGLATKFAEWGKSGAVSSEKIFQAVKFVAKGIAKAADVVGVLKLAFDLVSALIQKRIAFMVTGFAKLVGAIEAVAGFVGVDLAIGGETLNTIADSLNDSANAALSKVGDDFLGKTYGESVDAFFKDWEQKSKIAAENSAKAHTDALVKAGEEAKKKLQASNIFGAINSVALGKETSESLQKRIAGDIFGALNSVGKGKGIGGSGTGAGGPDLGGESGGGPIQFSGAITAGSSAARSAILANRFGSTDPQKDIKKATEETAKQTKIIADKKPFEIKLVSIS